jgi:hypothetical protein
MSETEPEDISAENDRTTGLGLFNFGHSYWVSAAALEEAQIDATHSDSPIVYLYVSVRCRRSDGMMECLLDVHHR